LNRQEHLLVIVAEECAEIQHAIAKALRFGLEGTNAQQIHKEFNDLLAALRMLDVSIFADGDLVQDKVEQYLLHSKQQGTLDD